MMNGYNMFDEMFKKIRDWGSSTRTSLTNVKPLDTLADYRDSFAKMTTRLQNNDPSASPFLNSPLNDTLQKIGQGILSFNPSPVSSTTLANGLLTKSPDNIPYLNNPNYSWFGDKRTHHHYKDKTVADTVQGHEETIGGLKNTAPIALMAAYMGGRVLRPVTKHLPIVNLLFNPMVLALGAGAASYFMVQNEQNKLTGYLQDTVAKIQNGNADDGDNKGNLLTHINILTQNKSDRSNASFNNISNADKEILSRNADLLKSQILSGKVTDIFSGDYTKSNGTQLFKKLTEPEKPEEPKEPKEETTDKLNAYKEKKAEYDNLKVEYDNLKVEYDKRKAEYDKYNAQYVSVYKNLFEKVCHNSSYGDDWAIPAFRTELDLNETDKNTLFKEAGLSQTSIPKGISQEEYLNHAKNLYKRRHSALEPVFASIEQMINQDSQSLLLRLQQNPMYKGIALEQFQLSVRDNVITETSKYFSNHPDIMEITRSMIQKKWLDISKDYAQRFIK